MDLSNQLYVIRNWNAMNTPPNPPDAERATVLGVDQSGNLQLSVLDGGRIQQLYWVLVPNLILSGGAYGGYSIVHNATQKALLQPTEGQQVTLGNDPAPFGKKSYCWTLFGVGTTPDPFELWSIQDWERGPVLDAKANANTEGTPILFWNWNGGNNQKWIFTYAGQVGTTT